MLVIPVIVILAILWAWLFQHADHPLVHVVFICFGLSCLFLVGALNEFWGLA